MAEGRIRVLSAEDHPLLREGITAVVNNAPDMKTTLVPSSDVAMLSHPAKLARVIEVAGGRNE